ncbi:thioredoxin family protein [bacterium LRH843]|nr:thioredoxin family protein [bacterium LRH843]
MKKVIIYGGIIVLLFISLAVVTTMKQTEQSAGNPYGKDRLNPATIELLDDPNYQNVILPDELDEKLSKGENVTVYFYKSDCPYCKEATPRLVPLAEELGVEIVQYNLLEFEQGWRDYGIESTPTLVHFEAGKEKGRVVGAAPNEGFEAFLNEYALNK